MEIVEAAVRMILRGSKLIATNIDPNCPTSQGLRPGCGAIVAMLETATGLKAFSVGKPSPVMMRVARKELGMATSETIARYSREHNGANVLALGATLVTVDEAKAIVNTWLTTPMREPRYIARLTKIRDLEKRL